MFNPAPLPDLVNARLFSLVVAVGLLASSCLIPGEALAQERKVFVEEGGEPVAVASGPWEVQDGYLAVGSTGEDAGLYAGQELGTGDFHIRARLRIPALLGSGAAFQMGESYFGFDGPSRTLYLAGALAGEKHRPLKRHTDLLDGGRWFDFEVVRSGPMIRFLIDGEPVHTIPSFAPIGRIGFTFSPLGRVETMREEARLHVQHFEAQGELREEDIRPRGINIPLVDLAGEMDRQVVVDREPGQYLGHPTTVLLEDGETILTVYPKGHGEGQIVMKKSPDGGKTWSERLDVPDNWSTSKEVPTIYPVTGPEGERRLILFSGLYPIRMAVSEDGGETWSPLEPIGDFGGIVAMADLVPLETGSGHYMAFFHDDGRFIDGEGEAGQFFVYKTRSTDGGLTWSEPEVVVTHPDADLCEPGVIRSPDGKQLAMLLRENSRQYNAFVTFSDDEGETWSEPVELTGALTGDRHQAVYGPDGRLFISFRDTAHESPTQGDWVGWVGTYDDIAQGREGQYRVRLMDNQHEWDTAYPGVEVLPDGTIVATTYGHWTAGEEPYIVSVRFTLDELDTRASAR